MNLDALSDDPARRLQEYQESRAGEERELVAGLMLLRDTGVKLQPHQEAVLHYSPYGYAAGCHCEIRHSSKRPDA